MFCKNCGVQMEDNAMFCPSCGTKQEHQPAAVPVESPVFDQPQQPVWNQQPEPQKPFNRKRFFAVTIPCLLLVLALIFTGSYIGNAFVKLFTSSDGYFRYVTENVTEEAVDASAEIYDDLLDRLNLKKGDNKLKVSFSMGDKLKQLLSAKAGVDVSKLNDVSVELDTFANKKQLSAALQLFVGGEKDALVSAQGTYDKKEQNLAATLPGLTESWIGVSLPSEVSGMMETLADTDFSKVLPKGKTLKAIVGSGVKSALKELDDVEQTTDSFTAGDITQKGTKLSVNLDASDLRDMVVGFLNGVKDDKNLKKAVVETMENIEKLDLDLSVFRISDLPDSDEAYDALVEVLDRAADELEESKLASNTFSVDLELYVDAKGDVYGIQFVEHTGGDQMYARDTYVIAGYARNGSNVGYTFETYSRVKGSAESEKRNHVLVSGEGTASLFGGFNGSASVTVEGKTYANLAFKDLKVSGSSVKGTITLAPSEEVLSKLGNDVSSALGGDKLSASIHFDISKNKQDFSVDLLQGDESLLKIAVENRVNKGKKVKLPKEDDIESADSSKGMTNFTKSIDMDELKDRLGDLGIDANDLNGFRWNKNFGNQDVVAAPNTALDSLDDFDF